LITTTSRLPLLIEPEQLAAELNKPDIIIVDLCKPDIYQKSHIPGAIHIDYSSLVTSKPPVHGLVPDEDHLATLMSQYGIKATDTIVTYDDEGGGKAARFIYTLDILGHASSALLNGGLYSWANEGYPLQSTPNRRPVTNYDIRLNTSPVADREFIISHLGQKDLQIVDARSNAEYQGSRKMAEKVGHIPGAVNLDWVELMDQSRNLRLKTQEQLWQILNKLHISADLTTVVYCQTHHRSALMYFAFKYLGFEDVKGYPGSWSDWGNNPDTPVES